MLRRTFLSLSLGVASLGIAACNGGLANSDKAEKTEETRDYTKSIKEPLYAPAKNVAKPAAPSRAADPVVLPDCRLSVYKKEEVPAQHDGRLLFVGTEIKPGDESKIPPDQIIKVKFGKQEKRFRYLREGDYVEKGQLMGILDERLAQDDVDIKMGKIEVAKQEWIAAEKVRDEYKARWDTALRLGGGSSSGSRLPAMSQEDVRLADVQYKKAFYEAQSKDQAIKQAVLEANQSVTVLSMHEIRPEIGGVFKAKHKMAGEAVKNLEPVFTIHDLTTLRVEGMADLQNYSKLLKKVGQKVVVEPSMAEGPTRSLVGHLQEINGVAVGQNKNKMLIVSCSEDGTIRVWGPTASREEAIIRLPQTVGRSVACSPKGAAGNYLLCGAADGTARLWDLDALSNAGDPVHILKDQHRGPITCVAFSPDGGAFALGGEDRQISVWDTQTGKKLYALPGAHKGQVTSLRFTPQGKLISAGRDNTLRIWELGKETAHLEKTYERRSGDVTQLGISADGGRILLDQGKQLRVMTLPEGETEGVLQNASSAGNFSGFALFSPKGNLIVTTGGSDGRTQLWRTPSPVTGRANEIRQLIGSDRTGIPTSAAFAPDGSFLVTGGKDKQVLVWQMPTEQEINQEITAEVTLVEPAVEAGTGAGQIRVWAVMSNPGRRFLPGSPVTMVINPD